MEIVVRIDWGSLLVGVGLGWLFLFGVGMVISYRQVRKAQKESQTPQKKK